jgi:hypothetical protein
VKPDFTEVTIIVVCTMFLGYLAGHIVFALVN